MKKLLTVLSVCALTLPIAVQAQTHSKKAHKQHHAKRIYKDIYKDKDVLLTTPVAKDEVAHTWLNNVSGTMALVSNYMFRGISQSSNHPAVQGGLTYTFPVGFYLSTWGSSVKFNAPNGAVATSELDAIAGWRGSVGEHFTYDINYDRYNYPGARYANYNELNTLWAYYFFQLGVSYSANYAGTHASGAYYNGTITLDIPAHYAFNIQDLTLLAEMGHYSLARAAGLSYNDYSLTLNKKLNSTYTITAQWTGTNGRAQAKPNDDNQLVGMVTATF